MPRQRLTAERVLSEIERVVQSQREFQLNDTVVVSVILVEIPQGKGRSRRSEISLEKHLFKKKSIVRIRNDDDLCLARSLVVAIAYLDQDSRYKYIADHRRPLQTQLAQELHEKAEVALDGCGIDEVKQLQAYLTDY